MLANGTIIFVDDVDEIAFISAKEPVEGDDTGRICVVSDS